jgi:tRNA G46 methylase TrmB
VESKAVSSNQEQTHPDLQAVVEKHLNTRFLRPIPPWVSNLAETLVREHGEAPWILDSGCGTGLSSVQLAKAHPNHWVLGIDQSAHRLGKVAQAQPANLRLVRADAQDLWRALSQINVKVDQHYLLYPNPWPKAHHLMRRWHGHPVWPALLALKGKLELRTNWLVYAEEFEQALLLSGCKPVPKTILENAEVLKNPITLFEKKYAENQHVLTRLQVQL